MQILLLGNGSRGGVLETVERLRPAIEKRATIVAVDFTGLTDLSGTDADLAVVFGGDGSVLRAAHQMGIRQKPVIAVHLGTLNFLATIRAEELTALLDKPDLLRLSVTEHLMLSCSLSRKSDASGAEKILSETVLNEVLVSGRSRERVLELDLAIDGEWVTAYRADGLLVSTPIGSTAHNLSAGGPIIRKETDAIVLSPISPHTLSNRPLVDSPDRCYEIRVKQSAVLVLDGTEPVIIEPGDVILIRRSPYTFKMIDVPGYSYYRTLNNKLGWNRIGDR